MDKIVEKLTEIENAANAIIQHTNIQKQEYKKKIQKSKQEFNDALATETSNKIHEIETKSQETLDKQLAQLQKASDLAIANFEEQYTLHHEEIAKDLLSAIIKE